MIVDLFIDCGQTVCDCDSIFNSLPSDVDFWRPRGNNNSKKKKGKEKLYSIAGKGKLLLTSIFSQCSLSFKRQSYYFE